MSNELSILLVSVGNTRTAIGLASGPRIERVERIPNAEQSRSVEMLRSLFGENAGDAPLVLIASVNRSVSEPLRRLIVGDLGVRVVQMGVDLPIPVGTSLDPEARPGQDRLLNAAAAFDRFRQACVVIDAGTALTIDFVDGQGTFHGGAIAPGAQMQLNAMHAGTDALPQLQMDAPLPESFAGNTTQAMLQGVYYGIRGAVRHLAERYAEAYEAYPIIVATGGDAHLLFDDDELIEHIVDDLPLYGMLAAYRIAHGAVESAED